MPSKVNIRKPSPVARTDEPDTPEPSIGVGWTRPRRLATIALGVLVVMAGAGVWYLANPPTSADTRPAISKKGDYTPGSLPSTDAEAAVRAAVDNAPRILSYDYRTLDKHLAAVSGSMTPTFAATFTDTFTTIVKPAATKNQAATKTLVRGGGVVSMTDDDSKATIMLFADQVLITAKGADKAKPSLGRERITVSMRQIDGRWLIDNIKPF